MTTTYRSSLARRNFTKHGQSNSPTHRAWMLMNRRCHNRNHSTFKHYGGRGITICERWKEFANFFADMGQRPEGCSLERKDVNGNYEPGNCTWATQKEQCRNKRNSRNLTMDGISLTVAGWAEKLAIPQARILARLKLGWDTRKALTTPKLKNGYT